MLELVEVVTVYAAKFTFNTLVSTTLTLFDYFSNQHRPCASVLQVSVDLHVLEARLGRLSERIESMGPHMRHVCATNVTVISRSSNPGNQCPVVIYIYVPSKAAPVSPLKPPRSVAKVHHCAFVLLCSDVRRFRKAHTVMAASRRVPFVILNSSVSDSPFAASVLISSMVITSASSNLTVEQDSPCVFKHAPCQLLNAI